MRRNPPDEPSRPFSRLRQQFELGRRVREGRPAEGFVVEIRESGKTRKYAWLHPLYEQWEPIDSPLEATTWPADDPESWGAARKVAEEWDFPGDGQTTHVMRISAHLTEAENG